MEIPAHFQLSTDPRAAVEATQLDDGARFTVLTSRLIRLEHSHINQFEDRPSQVVWYRNHPVPDYEVIRTAGRLELVTEHLHLYYQPNPEGFAPDSLSIVLRGTGVVWRYGDRDSRNLLGTARTLDQVSGSTQLEKGLLSRSGWSVIDDSSSLVFDGHGWLQPRKGDNRDIYFFGFGRDFTQCLRDYCQITGHAPMPPRWVLGNWWSRYWPYTADELKALMREFQEQAVPLSVCIVDMDWHIVDTGRGYSGWTGYTWNQDLFPDPRGFIAWLHEHGLRTALNLHPASGVRPHEEMYPEIARRMGIEPATGATVEFDLTSPRFAQAYFELLHHPQEKNGVDFWWIDWQQGEESRLTGLDPLWWLNHLHYYDLGRDGWKRPVVFSRWGGLGNHRYPIGFSGDTVINWESLAFQPYFTATAANVNYGWWSHDIGGHMRGVEEPDLYTRWVQFGVFSPILRLHSTQNPFHERRPWGWDAEVFRITREAMQLRHALIPYLYTMGWKNATEDIPLVRPMYHDHPDQEASYYCPQQYYFGSELVAAPFTSPADPDTHLSRQLVWLPEGDWFDFFTAEHYPGNAWYVIYGKLEKIPVFARAGAIIPLGPKVGWGGIANPSELDIHLFAGADNEFTLYEDDGETTGYLKGEYCLTHLKQLSSARELQFTISAVQGMSALVPPVRKYRLHVHGVASADEIRIRVGQEQQQLGFRYCRETESLHLNPVDLPSDTELALVLNSNSGTLLSRRNRTLETCQGMLRAFKMETNAKAALNESLEDFSADPAQLSLFESTLSVSQARALLEVTQQAGVHYIADICFPHLLIVWNNRGRPGMRYHFAGRKRQPTSKTEVSRAMKKVPRFEALTPKGPWRLTGSYFGQVLITYDEGA